MSPDEVLEILITTKTKKEALSIIKKAWGDYVQLIYRIAEDIYDSCIKDYYEQYTPTQYKRHDGQEGSNLYQAKDFYTDNEFILEIGTDPSNLDPYRYPKGKDIREKVLYNVLHGKRGTGMRKRQSDWPMEWNTSYPNRHSNYNDWNSNYTKIQDILDDFEETVVEQTFEKLFYGLIEAYL